MPEKYNIIKHFNQLNEDFQKIDESNEKKIADMISIFKHEIEQKMDLEQAFIWLNFAKDHKKTFFSAHVKHLVSLINETAKNLHIVFQSDYHKRSS